jgi:excisionase family DNA binding protein
MNHSQPIHGSELRSMLRDGALLSRASVEGRRDVEHQEVLTLVEVARMLRVERHHVAKLIERGLPYHRVGSRFRFLHHEVIAWLKAQKETE